MVLFFDCKGIVYCEFVTHGHGINAAWYLEILRNLHRAIQHNQTQAWRVNSWVLQHDGAPAHWSVMVQAFMNATETTVVDHPPYSPDLAPCDFWIFACIKKHLKGHRFNSVTELCDQIDTVISSVTQREFVHAMGCLPTHWQKCIAARGSYFK